MRRCIAFAAVLIHLCYCALSINHESVALDKSSSLKLSFLPSRVSTTSILSTQRTTSSRFNSRFLVPTQLSSLRDTVDVTLDTSVRWSRRRRRRRGSSRGRRRRGLSRRRSRRRSSSLRRSSGSSSSRRRSRGRSSSRGRSPRSFFSFFGAPRRSSKRSSPRRHSTRKASPRSFSFARSSRSNRFDFGSFFGFGRRSIYRPRAPKRRRPVVRRPPPSPVRPRLPRMARECGRADLYRRRVDGKCNNLRYYKWGATGTSKLPLATPLSGRRGSLSARVITNSICRQPFVVRNKRRISEFTTFFGQFLDHDIAGSKAGSTKWNIPIPAEDPAFTRRTIPFTRHARTRSINGRGRAPINMLSHYIDASTIYGSSAKEAKAVREGKSGYLKIRRGLLSEGSDGRFISGDARVNENPILTAMHTLWAREHNRVAEEVKKANPRYTDQKLFELAQLIVGAEMQAVTYYEFIPAFMGRLLPRYRGYSPNVIGAVTNEFSTVAFRVGHTMINPKVRSMSSLGRVTELNLGDTFFRPDIFKRLGLDSFVRGVMTERAGEIDNGVTSEVLDFLINGEDNIKLDLAALNIQRARDHGIRGYNDLRRQFGLRPYRDFEEISRVKNVVARLRRVFRTVDNIDAWVGGLCEDHVVGSLGPLFAAIWRDQFLRLRDGDRFYFERRGVFTRTQIRTIPSLARLLGPNRQLGSIMKRIIADNTGISVKYLRRSSPFFV